MSKDRESVRQSVLANGDSTNCSCSDEALVYEMWMSKEPAEVFEMMADKGFVGQHHISLATKTFLANVSVTPTKRLRNLSDTALLGMR